MSVLTPDFQPIADSSRTVVSVTTGSGSSYTVDVREGRCTCPDYEHREPDGGCKHLRRARLALAHDSVDSDTLARLDIDAGLGANAPGPVVATSDGGIVNAGDGEIIDENAPATWEGPFTEYDKYGEPTGERYVRCSGCGVEVLTGGEENAPHRDGCSGC
jgi:hypothetical protein